jgi:hypothetical protein
MPSISETVQLCCSTYYSAVAEQMAKPVMKRNFDHVRATFLRHIPFLSDAENIRVFIACVSHGMLIGAIRMPDGTKLLYAAQIAHSALPREVRPVGRPRNSASPHPEPSEVEPQPAEKAPAAPQPEKNTPTPSPEPAQRSAASADQRETSAPPPQPENKYPTPSPAPPNGAPESENDRQNGNTRAPRPESRPEPSPAPSSAPPAAATPPNGTTRHVA